MRFKCSSLLVFVALLGCPPALVLAQGESATIEHGVVSTPVAGKRIAASTAGMAGALNSSMHDVDVDGDGVFDALTDGVLVIRYLFGLRGEALTQGAISSRAVRTTPAQIAEYMAALTERGPAGNVLDLGCMIAAVPASSPAFPVVPGTMVTLTPMCIGQMEPLSYVWHLGGLQLIEPEITVAPAQMTTYKVVPFNGMGTGYPAYRTVFAGPQPPVPGDCSILASDTGGPIPSAPASGFSPLTRIRLTLGCASGGPLGTCLWDNGITSTSCVIEFAVSVTTTYTAYAVNGGGMSPPVVKVVEVLPPAF